MKPVTKFWLLAILPFLLLAAGISLRLKWVKYDITAFILLVSSGVSMIYWWKAFGASSWLNRFLRLSLVVPIASLLFSLFILKLDYSKDSGTFFLSYPWMAARMGAHWAQVRMADAKVAEAYDPDKSRKLFSLISAMRQYRRATSSGCPFPYIRPSAVSVGLYSSDILGDDPIGLLTAAAYTDEPLAAYGLGLLYDAASKEYNYDYKDEYAEKYKDAAKAKYWFFKAAGQGEGDAIITIVSRYETGWPAWNLEKDMNKAEEWENKIPQACKKGNVNFRYGHYDLLP